MKPIGLSELKCIQLDILRNVSEYCEAKNIRYFIIYGTLIGAIRHKGYSPWDDDIDIAMPRPDYEKFIAGYSHDFYKTTDNYKDAKYGLASAKVHDSRTIIKMDLYNIGDFGVFIDVFPIDGFASKWQIKAAQILQKIIKVKKVKINFTHGVIKNLVSIWGKALLVPFSLRTLISLFDKISKMRNFESSDLCDCFSSEDVEKEVFPRLYFEKYEYATFEGEKFRIPAEYDRYLRQIYGDYMQLPPEDKRVAHHGMKAFWR